MLGSNGTHSCTRDSRFHLQVRRAVGVVALISTTQLLLPIGRCVRSIVLQGGLITSVGFTRAVGIRVPVVQAASLSLAAHLQAGSLCLQ